MNEFLNDHKNAMFYGKIKKCVQKAVNLQLNYVPKLGKYWTVKATRQGNRKVKAENYGLTKQMQETFHKHSVDIQEDLRDDLMKIFYGVVKETYTFYTIVLNRINELYPLYDKSAKSFAAYEQLKVYLKNETGGVLVSELY